VRQARGRARLDVAETGVAQQAGNPAAEAKVLAGPREGGHQRVDGPTRSSSSSASCAQVSAWATRCATSAGPVPNQYRPAGDVGAVRRADAVALEQQRQARSEVDVTAGGRERPEDDATELGE
jgi:hypothetical protein